MFHHYYYYCWRYYPASQPVLSVLAFGRCYRALKSKTNRSKTSFYPQAVMSIDVLPPPPPHLPTPGLLSQLMYLFCVCACTLTLCDTMHSIGTVLFSTRVSQLKFLSCFQILCMCMSMRVFMRTYAVYTALRASVRPQPRVCVCGEGGCTVLPSALRLLRRKAAPYKSCPLLL